MSLASSKRLDDRELGRQSSGLHRVKLERPRSGAEPVLDAWARSGFRLRVVLPYGDIGVLSPHGFRHHATHLAVPFVYLCVQVDGIRPQRLDVECVRNDTAADTENLQCALITGAFDVYVYVPAGTDRVIYEPTCSRHCVGRIGGEYHQLAGCGPTATRRLRV